MKLKNNILIYFIKINLDFRYKNMVRFKNKEEALQKLYEIFDVEKIDSETVILAISKNGIYYAKEIAKKVGFVEADYLFSEPIVSPVNKDTILGCISETKDMVFVDELIEAFNISWDFIYSEAERVYNEKIIPYIYEYRLGDSLIDLKDRKVILIDEGANTGLTLEVCIKSCINACAKEVDVAMPLIPASLAKEIKKVSDYCYFVYEIENYVETDFYFEDRKDKYEL
jgi:putative phosphoribosyl transferase